MTKNFKGGYKIVSLNGNDLTSESAFTVKGLYEDLADSYSKPILVSEIVIDDEKQQDAYAVVKKTESGYTIDVYGYALTVTDEDAVTSEALPEITSIGEGLTLEDGELSADGGGSQLYLHTIYWKQSDTYYGSFNYISTVSSFASLKDVVEDWHSKFSDTNTFIDIVASGICSANELIFGMKYYNATGVIAQVFKTQSGTTTGELISYSGITTFEDRVITL